MWAMLSKYRLGVWMAVYVSCGIAIFTMGYRTAANRYQAEIGHLKTQYAQEQAEREKRHADSLQVALNDAQKWQDFARKQGVQLAQAQQQLDIQAAQIAKDNHHAIQQDNADNQPFNGIGTHSLRQYKRAFGYTDD